jgi:hypothetical protein
MLETSLTVRYSIYDDARERSHLFWFYRELETMIEASYLLCSRLPVPESAIIPVHDHSDVRSAWKNKTMLEDEIRSLRIKNAEMETELIRLRYFREHGKEFGTE